jgi:hypothetical protein
MDDGVSDKQDVGAWPVLQCNCTARMCLETTASTRLCSGGHNMQSSDGLSDGRSHAQMKFAVHAGNAVHLA